MQIIGLSAFWIVIIIAALIIELITVGLVSVWFALGGAAGLIAQMMGAPLWAQTGLFLLVSVASMVLTRPWAIKHLNARQVASNIDEIIGSRVHVVETIDNKKDTGKVLRNGLEWTARAKDDNAVFEQGDDVRVVEVAGVKLIVEKETGN